MNLPAFLNSLLHDVAQSMKKSQYVESVIRNHGLIWLIVSHSLAQQQSSWEEIIATINWALTLPTPKWKHTASTPNRPSKRENQLDWHGLERGWKIPKGILANLWR